ncbi:Baeyer-Villiger monooxygenase [Lachnellula hyalina]|uniref:Baeyer-Villiger monooxygenase n=1 Tax=Lachnellula hyalina TaxID=1316788 RepID=A0A8H8R1A7_9HELO|nr:Baeyer-Villiger monooxygenase [Lachnellula hyalina]TVY26702.1 Baeyer-Villiger monooxygenase [Lachnellula hyalina]
MGSNTLEYDALIVGAGFGGCHVLKTLRDRGFKTLAVDDGDDLGGVWHFNRYPGARVDSKVPLYEFSNKEVWSDWNWTVKYPGWAEIQDYFQHVEAKLHLKKDIRFNTRITAAQFDDSVDKWHITAQDGSEFIARYFILCIGSFAKPYIPDFKGIDTFTGVHCHTSNWPRTGIEYAGKRVGVVGNASSGLQTIQEIAPDVKHLTVFQRSPTYALPMRQAKLTEKDQDKSTYEAIFGKRSTMFAGIDQEFNWDSCVKATDEERQAFFEGLWEQGGLLFWLANYQDVIIDKEANAYAYTFWRNKVIQRIKDPKVAEILAPEIPPFFFGTKRATLEQRYYEVYNQENVDLINAKVNPIKEIVPSGVITEDGILHELDLLVLATGYDAVTGGFTAIDIKGSKEQSLKEKWLKGSHTAYGMATAGFPNMFFPYGPQAPTTFCNGPTCAEIQGDWIASALEFMREKKLTRIDAKEETEAAWREQVNMIGNMTLIPQTQSEYMGTNIPGKPKEMLNYLGGLPRYVEQIEAVRDSGYAGFDLK